MRNKVITCILMLFFILLQSVAFKKLPGNFVYPDIALIILIFFSNSKGIMTGQICGFITGLTQDFLSLSPPGFNSFIRTAIAFIFGSMKGKIFIDPILFPVILTAIATLLKGVLSVIIAAIFIKPESSPIVFTARFALELLENCILSPFIFGFLKFFKIYSVNDRGF